MRDQKELPVDPFPILTVMLPATVERQAQNTTYFPRVSSAKQQPDILGRESAKTVAAGWGRKPWAPDLMTTLDRKGGVEQAAFLLLGGAPV